MKTNKEYQHHSGLTVDFPQRASPICIQANLPPLYKSLLNGKLCDIWQHLSDNNTTVSFFFFWIYHRAWRHNRHGYQALYQPTWSLHTRVGQMAVSLVTSPLLSLLFRLSPSSPLPSHIRTQSSPTRTTHTHPEWKCYKQGYLPTFTVCLSVCISVPYTEV